MKTKNDERPDGDESQARKLWAPPKLFRVQHNVAGSNSSAGPFGDSPFLYS